MFRKTRIRKRSLVAGVVLVALAAPATAHAGGRLDPSSTETHARLVAQGYIDASLSRQGNGGRLDPSSPETQARLVAQGYIDPSLYRQNPSGLVDGRSPDTKDFSTLAHEPVVTVTKSQGFQWGDFGIGTGVAFAAVILLALAMRFLSGRRDRKPGSVATA
jgi:hypothetical protein